MQAQLKNKKKKIKRFLLILIKKLGYYRNQL